MKIQRHHIIQFSRYLIGGFTAAGAELCTYQILLWTGLWYLVAATLSGTVGITTTFLMQKYFVFKKRERTLSQARRFAVQQGANAAVQVFLVYCFVDLLGIDPMIAKILSIGASVSWNFFIYKFLIYV